MPETYHAGETVRDDERVADLIAEIRSLADKVEHGANKSISAAELIRRARHSSRPTRLDGYPPSALGGGVSSGPSDRTGNVVANALDRAEKLAALGGNPPDPAKAALRHLLNDLARAERALADALRQLRSVTPKEPVNIPDVCRVCAQPPTYQADRCRWCYGFSVDYGQDPPEDLYLAHLAGERITQARVREVLDRPTGQKGRMRR